MIARTSSEAAVSSRSIVTPVTYSSSRTDFSRLENDEEALGSHFVLAIIGRPIAAVAMSWQGVTILRDSILSLSVV